MNTQSQLQDIILLFFKEFFSALLNPLILILFLVLVVFAICFFIQNKIYKRSAYYQITQNSYLSVLHDKGRLGEYKIYQNLKFYETDGGKFLFNIYLPKEDGQTTEIDVLLLCSKGIFVFESKNYSGWIFGSEYKKNWYQTLPQGRGRSHKEHFYNPILQNRTHIKYLKKLVGDEIPIQSIIVFSERCELKHIQLKSNDTRVIKRNAVAPVVSKIYSQTADIFLEEHKIEKIYSTLYPYTQVSAEVKSKHIAEIRKELADNDRDNKMVLKSISATEKRIEKESATPPAPELLKCPKCGGALVLRTAQRGQNKGNQFYGCSNFPKCRYIQHLADHNADTAQ